MRLRIAGNIAASDDAKPPAPPQAAATGDPRPAPIAAAENADGAGGPVTAVVAVPAAHRNGAENGSKDELFFEARPWLDSDSEDDFYSVRGDFTPSRSSTPVHPRLTTSFSGQMPVDRLKPSLIKKKQRLLELLQEKQHYDDDDDDSVTDGSSDMENGTVRVKEHMKTSGKGEKSKKSSRSGCFPSLIWKHNFTSGRRKRKEHKDKVY